jgi:tetratricopeptide (TPR) repeat protein
MVLGTPLDRRADVFATGVSLYELLCDKRPFEGDTPNAILSGIAYGKAVGPRTLNPALSPELEALITHCLERSPEARPATALAVKDELDKLLTHESAFGASQVAELMELLFPAKRDAERQRIEELRVLDPSHPSAPPVSVRPEERSTGGQVTSPERVRLPEIRLPSQGAATPPPPAPSRAGALPMILASALLLAGGAVAAWRYIPALVPHHAPDPKEVELEALEAELAKAPDDAQLHLRHAEALLGLGQASKAEAEVDKVLVKNPDLAHAHALKGELLEQRRLGAKSLAEYQRALELRPDDEPTWAHLASLQEARGDLPAARTALQKAMALRPGDRALTLRLADLLNRTQDWDRAAELLGPLASRNLQDAEVRTALGYALLNKKDLPHAQTELEAAVRLAPKAYLAQYYLGTLYYQKGIPGKATEAYQASIASAPNPHEAALAHAALGQLLLEKGDRDGAKKELGEAVSGDKEQVEALHQLQKLQ